MLQFITHQTERYSYIDSVRLALEGGCRWVQLRMKDATTRELVEAAQEALALCRKAGATLIIDDRIDVVMAVGADGVHLGQKDMPISMARRILGPKRIIGGTANTLEQVAEHARQGADYVGCGPFRFTTTKKGLSPILGIEGYRGITAGMRSQGIGIPIVAIGGIVADDIPAIMQTGVTGIALSGAVLNAPDPAAEMRRLITLTEGIKQNIDI